MIHRQIYFSINDTCSSHHSVETAVENQHQCRNADISKDQDEKSLRREHGAGEECDFVSFSDASDPDLKVPKVDYSKCGFNKDSAGH